MGGIHFSLVMITKEPHWAITDEEKTALAKSAVDVLQHFPEIAASGKLVDFGMLAWTVGIIYGPRILMTVQGSKNEEQKQNVLRVA